MTPSTVITANPASNPTDQEGMDRLRLFLLLVGLTLQAANDTCDCPACQSLRQHAGILAPVILKMAARPEQP